MRQRTQEAKFGPMRRVPYVGVPADHFVEAPAQPNTRRAVRKALRRVDAEIRRRAQ